MTSTHLVNKSQARRVRRSVYDSFIPPSQPTTAEPARPCPASPALAVLCQQVITTSADGDWLDLTSFAVDLDRSPSGSELSGRRDATVVAPHEAPTPLPANTLARTAEPNGDAHFADVTAGADTDPVAGCDAPAALLALAHDVASGAARPEVRAEALEWLRDLGGVPQA